MALIVSKAPKKKQFIEDIFKAKAAQNRGIVRRAKSSVDKYASEEDLKAAVKKRGFHLLLLGQQQYLILCNSGTLTVISN